MRWTAVVPLKLGPDSKSRLAAVLSPAARSELGNRMAGHVIAQLGAVGAIGEIVVRIERAYAASLKGKVRAAVEALFNVWNVGLSLSAGGFTAR